MTIVTSDLARVRAVMRSTEGMDLSGMKDTQLERRVSSFCQRQRIESIDDLVHRLRTNGDLRVTFLDRLTINVSNVYRNPASWKVLEERVLPLLGKRVSAWSAGCSIGAETYSLAIAVVRAGAEPDVLGSDIDRESLQRAQQGIYRADEMREVPSQIAERYFTREGDCYLVNAEISRRVRFERRDLLNGPPPPRSFDLIACRNVVIYFNEEAKDRLHKALAGRLRPGGVLFVGNAERVSHPADLGLVGIGPQFYRKAE